MAGEVDADAQATAPGVFFAANLRFHPASGIDEAVVAQMQVDWRRRIPPVLIARIYEVFALPCPMCGGQMRLIAFITEGTQIRKILEHIDSQAPRISSHIPRTRATVVLALVRRVEDRFPTLDQAGCKVGIGAATGADQAFIGKFDTLDVEDDRKLPLVMTRDILNGTVEWRGFGVINPFCGGGWPGQPG